MKAKSGKWIIWSILTVLVTVGFLVPLGCWYLAVSVSNQLGDRWPYDPMEYILHSAPQWTPDGSRIIFAYWGDIYAVNRDGSALNRIHGSDRGNDVQMCPNISGDGSRIAYNKFQGGDYHYNARWSWMTSALDGSDIQEPDEHFNEDWGAPCSLGSVSPDGSRIAFTRNESRGPDGIDTTVLYATDYPRDADDLGAELAVAPGIDSPRWSPDGSQLAFVEWDYDPDAERRRWRIVTLSGSDLNTTLQAADGADYGRHPRIRDVHQLAWSPDGTKLLISSVNFISAVNADGAGLQTLARLRYNPERHLHASWSPDGSKIAVYNGRGSEGALFTMSPDGSNKRVLTQYGNPLRPAQNQEWDPAFDATPTPADSGRNRTMNP